MRNVHPRFFAYFLKVKLGFGLGLAMGLVLVSVFEFWLGLDQN